MENLTSIEEQPNLVKAIQSTQLNANLQSEVGKEIINIDTPTNASVNIDATSNESINNEPTSSGDAGSPYGKFKTAQDLLNAYNSLQVEFTKKCQKLSELTKPNKEQSDGLNETTSNKIATKQNEGDALQQKLLQLVKSSLNKNEETHALSNDASMQTFNLSTSSTARAEKLNNDDFKILSDYILSNPTLRFEVLKNALDGVTNNNAPKLISSNKGATSLTKPQKVNSVSEAGKLALNMFGAK